MKKYLTKEIFIILAISLVPVFLIYLPFLLKIKHLFFLDLKDSGMVQIIRNWDGPHYLIVAKSLYDKEIIKTLLFAPLDLKYYAAHFPLFPIFIKLLAPIFGWLYSGIVVNLIFGFLTNVIFYLLAKKYTKYALFLTFVFTVFPPRFLVVRSIIAPETVMVFFIILSLWLWEEKKYFFSGLSGALATLTKLQAGFLFPAYLAAEGEKWLKEGKMPSWKVVWSGLIPLSFVLLSTVFYYRFDDFGAFLSAEKHNDLYFNFPFSQYNYKNAWTGTGWLEDVVFYTIAWAVLTITLWKSNQRVWFFFSLFYTLFLIILPQRDITRFSFQLAPIFFITFHEFFTSKTFKYALFFALPAIYFYVLNFIMTNQAPIADWNHFMK